MGKLFIIDLMPFLYKGHFVFLRNPRITSTGINTSALFGFANGVASIIKDNAPTHVVLAMDPEGPTFRHDRYPLYKAQREKMPEELFANIAYAFELAEALGIPVIRKAGYEADDIMGTLAARAAEQGFEVYLATPDKDAAQLVGDNVYLYRPAHGKEAPEIYDTEKVKEHWHLDSPKQMIDYLALAGDTADNIPGIKGVGEKTAAALLNDWGSVEAVIEHASELKGKLAEKVAASVDDALLSKFLTTIRTDVPLEVDLEDFKFNGPDREKLAAVCAKYELTQFARRMLGDDLQINTQQPVGAIQCGTIETVPHDYRLVKTLDGMRALAEKLIAAPKVAFDTETTGTDARKALLVGMSFATAKGKAWYVALPDHLTETDHGGEEDLFGFASAGNGEGKIPFAEVKDLVQLFAPVFADPSKILVAQNAKFDIAVLSRYGIRFGSTVRDTMLEHYVLDAAMRHGMDVMAMEHINYSPIPIERLIGAKERGKEQLNMRDLPPEEILDYAAEDADVTFQIDEVLRPKVVTAGLEQVLATSEEPLVQVLVDMEREGVRIDTDALARCGEALGAEIAQLEREILMAAAEAGFSELNLNSPRQLGDFIFGKLAPNSAAAKKTSRGQFATDEKTLLRLAEDVPLVKKVLEYRVCTKLKSTYVDKLPACIDPVDGRVHTKFAQAFTETGRLSSSDPNLQNIPVRTERGKLVRAAVVARDDNHRLVSADYSQIELRIMAAMSGDESMIDAFRRGEDIHRLVASRVFGVMPGLVTPEQRSGCKMVNFGIIYGISAFGLSQRLRISRQEASSLIETYFEQYPKIRAFMDKAVADARTSGYAVTLTGRRRSLANINSRNATVRQAAERDAINTPIQGTAADLIKIAMVKIAQALRKENLKSKMVLQIHDELLFDCPVDEVERVKEIARREMVGAMDFGVPLEVGIGEGRNWLEAH